MNKDEEKDFLDDWREGVRASIDYFSRDNEPEMERDAVKEFLDNIGVAFTEEDVISVEKDPPDVLFQGARFEVKEILDSGRRRDDEYRELLKKAEASTNPSDAFDHFTPKDLTPLQVGELLLEKLRQLEMKYEPKFKCSLDLLVYVNLLRHFHKAGPMPSRDLFDSSGWRSVCAVSGRQSYVFGAAEDAPDFIKNMVQKVSERQS